MRRLKKPVLFKITVREIVAAQYTTYTVAAHSDTEAIYAHVAGKSEKIDRWMSVGCEEICGAEIVRPCTEREITEFDKEPK